VAKALGAVVYLLASRASPARSKQQAPRIRPDGPDLCFDRTCATKRSISAH
jgi:hypothetical protein